MNAIWHRPPRTPQTGWIERGFIAAALAVGGLIAGWLAQQCFLP